MELFLKKLEEHAAAMVSLLSSLAPCSTIDTPAQPETAAAEENEMPQVQLNGSSPNALVNSAAGAAGALAGWAISSLSRQIASGTLQSTVASTLGTSIDRPTSAPAANAGNTLATSSSSSSLGGSTFGATKMQSDIRLAQGGMLTSKGKGMQLGSTKLPASAASNIPDWAEEAAAEVDTSTSTNPWGNDDLMDVNADEDDWSAFAAMHPFTTEKCSSFAFR